MAGPEEIAKAKITVEADVSGVKPAISDAKKEVKGLGDEAEKAGSKGSGALNKIGASAEGVASKLSKVTGAVGAIAAGAVAIGTAVKALNEYFKDGKKLAADYLKQFDSVQNAEAALEGISARLIEVNAELERLQAKPFSITGRNKRQIEQEIETLRNAQLSVSRQVKAQREKDARDAAEAFKEEARRVARDIEESYLPGDIQIQRAAQRQKDAFIKAAEEAGVAIANAEAQLALKRIDQQAEIQIEAYRRAEQEKIRLEQRESQRRIEMVEKEADAFANRLRDQIAGIFGDEFTTVFEQIAPAVRDVADSVARLK